MVEATGLESPQPIVMVAWLIITDYNRSDVNTQNVSSCTTRTTPTLPPLQMLLQMLNFPCPECRRKYNGQGRRMAAGNGQQHMGITGEAVKEKEMLTRGDILLSVIAGPWRGLCDLGVPS